MYFRNRPKDPDLLMRVGLVMLVLASIMNLVVLPATHVSENWADALKGFLYGMAIALLLLSVVWRRRLRGQR